MLILGVGSAAAAAALREDARNGKGNCSVGDEMSSGMGAFRMLLRMVGSLSGVEGVDTFSWVSPSWSESRCRELFVSSCGSALIVSIMGRSVNAVTLSSGPVF
jgi:hypothetical protein